MPSFLSGRREATKLGEEIGHDIEVTDGLLRRAEEQQEASVRTDIVAL